MRRSGATVLLVAVATVAISIVGWRWRDKPHPPVPAAIRGKEEAGERLITPGQRKEPRMQRLSAGEHPAWSISGVVLDMSGAVLPEAVVCAVGEAHPCRMANPCMTADRSGRFAFDDVSSEAGALIASAPGHLARVHRLSEPRPPEPFHQTVSLRLAPGGVALAGTVVDVSGGTIAGALLSASVGNDASGVVVSDARGHFILHVPAGPVHVVARADGYALAQRDALAPAQGVVIGLVMSSALEGRVVTADEAAPVAGVTVQASNTDGLRAQPRVTLSDADGTFRLDGLPAGGYELQVLAPTWRSESAWVRVGVGAISDAGLLLVSPAALLRGSVQVDGEPCNSAFVELGGPVDSSHQARAGGVIEIGGLQPGSYRVSASCLQIASAPSVEELELGLDPVSRVWDLEPIGDAVAGAERAPPLASVRVRVTSDAVGAASTTPLLQTESGFAKRGRREGDELVFEGLPLGAYEVYLEESPSVRHPMVLDRDGQRALVQLVAPPLTQISGQVIDERGVPVPDAWVRVENASSGPGDAVSIPVLTDESGRFAAHGPFAGRHTVLVESATGRAQADGVAAGTMNLVLRVESHGRLLGHVKDAIGRDVTFALRIHRSGAEEIQRLDGVGTWSLPWMAPGTYNVAVTSEAGDASVAIRLEPNGVVEVPITVGRID